MFVPLGTREDSPKRRFPIVTVLLVIVNVIVFAYEVLLSVNFGDAGLAAFLQDFAVIPAKVTDGTPLETGLITSMFLHGGILHLLGNMLFLLPFGDNVEDRLGHVRYLLFYLVCGVAASLVHIMFSPNSTVPALGASGAIAGVLAGYLMLFPRGRVKGLFFLGILLIPLELPAIAFILFWFVMQLLNGLVSLGVPTSETAGGVAFWAHVGGFVVGLVLARILHLREARQPYHETE